MIVSPAYFSPAYFSVAGATFLRAPSPELVAAPRRRLRCARVPLVVGASSVKALRVQSPGIGRLDV